MFESREQQAATACFYLLEKHCPRLMRIGGGRLTKDLGPRKKTDEALVRQAWEAGASYREMAEIIGVERSSMAVILRRMGLTGKRKLGARTKVVRMAYLGSKFANSYGRTMAEGAHE